MRRVLGILLVVLLVLPMVAFSEAQSVVVSEGYRLTENGIDIALWENASTGYQWNYELDTEGVVQYLTEQIIADQSGVPTDAPGEDGLIVGAPSMHVWSFGPQGDGEAIITFFYERVWEQDAEEIVAPERTWSFTITVKGGKVVKCVPEDLSEDDGVSDDGEVEMYEGETGGVALDVLVGMKREETDEGTLLTSEDGLTKILVTYEPEDDAEELFEQLKDVDSASRIYDDEARGVSVISCDVDREAEVQYVTMVSYAADDVVVYNGYKAPKGGVLHVHTTYVLSDDLVYEEEEGWAE